MYNILKGYFRKKLLNNFYQRNFIRTLKLKPILIIILLKLFLVKYVYKNK